MIAQKTLSVARHTIHAPVTKDMLIEHTGVSAIILRNAGTATVNLEGNGAWTLDSKETLSLNVQELDVVLDFRANVLFDTSTGAVKKLQVITIKTAHC